MTESKEYIAKEIIDATQEAVVTTVDSVANMTSGVGIVSGAHHNLAFYETAEFWVGIAFILVVTLLFMPVRKMMMSMFDKRIALIIKRIDDAEALKVEAREVLAEYEDKVENVDAEVEDILKRSKKEANAFKNKTIKEIEKQLSAKERHIDDKIFNIRTRVENDIIQLVSAKTADVVEAVVISRLDLKEKSKLIDNSIDLIGRLK